LHGLEPEEVWNSVYYFSVQAMPFYPKFKPFQQGIKVTYPAFVIIIKNLQTIIPSEVMKKESMKLLTTSQTI
jgi:hypothetical protein